MMGSKLARPAGSPGAGGRSERGAGSIMAVAVVAGALVTLSALAPLSLVLQAKAVTAGAADAAALAAADAAAGIVSGPPATGRGRWRPPTGRLCAPARSTGRSSRFESQ